MKTSIFKSLYTHRVAIFTMVFLFMLACVPFAAHASPVTATDDAPWEKPLEKFVKVLSGPTALYISMIGLFFAGGILIFGGELGPFTRMIMMIVLVGSILTGITSFITKFVGSGCVLF
ncbi:MAG: TrbC/VirB2 family protein [Synergistaceae bacterium]|nr:TrbC/VirB2 family protein [Synergistaceae bacterium]MBR0094416.1 TrbC/VirB2 family protein [Synergistaceae bacterium]